MMTEVIYDYRLRLHADKANTAISVFTMIGRENSSIYRKHSSSAGGLVGIATSLD